MQGCNTSLYSATSRTYNSLLIYAFWSLTILWISFVAEVRSAADLSIFEFAGGRTWIRRRLISTQKMQRPLLEIVSRGLFCHSFCCGQTVVKWNFFAHKSCTQSEQRWRNKGDAPPPLHKHKLYGSNVLANNFPIHVQSTSGCQLWNQGRQLYWSSDRKVASVAARTHTFWQLRPRAIALACGVGQRRIQ